LNYLNSGIPFCLPVFERSGLELTRAVANLEHAWCERGEFVVDLAMPVGARIIVREQYYRAVKPEVGRTYSADEAFMLSVKNKHDGPWVNGEQNS